VINPEVVKAVLMPGAIGSYQVTVRAPSLPTPFWACSRRGSRLNSGWS